MEPLITYERAIAALAKAVEAYATDQRPATQRHHERGAMTEPFE